MQILHKRAKAEQDLKSIWLYFYKKHGEKQADKYYDLLILAMKTIEENPEIGTACDHIRTGYRQYQINKHIIFYRLSTHKIHIVRVLHEKMQSEKNL